MGISRYLNKLSALAVQLQTWFDTGFEHIPPAYRKHATLVFTYIFAFLLVIYANTLANGIVTMMRTVTYNFFYFLSAGLGCIIALLSLAIIGGLYALLVAHARTKLSKSIKPTTPSVTKGCFWLSGLIFIGFFLTYSLSELVLFITANALPVLNHETFNTIHAAVELPVVENLPGGAQHYLLCALIVFTWLQTINPLLCFKPKTQFISFLCATPLALFMFYSIMMGLAYG